MKINFTQIYTFLSAIVNQMETNKVRYKISRTSSTSKTQLQVQIFDVRFDEDIQRYLIFIDVKDTDKSMVDISFSGSLFDLVSFKSDVHGVWLKLKPLYNRIEKLEK